MEIIRSVSARKRTEIEGKLTRTSPKKTKQKRTEKERHFKQQSRRPLLPSSHQPCPSALHENLNLPNPLLSDLSDLGILPLLLFPVLELELSLRLNSSRSFDDALWNWVTSTRADSAALAGLREAREAVETLRRMVAAEEVVRVRCLMLAE